MSCGSWSRVVESGKQKSDGGREEVRSCVVEEGGGSGVWSGQGGKLLSSKVVLTLGLCWMSGRWRNGHKILKWGLVDGVWSSGGAQVEPTSTQHFCDTWLQSGALRALLVWKLCSTFIPLSPTAGISGWQPLRQGEGERCGVSRATSLLLGLLTWEERSSLPLFCPKPGVLTVPPDLTPPPPIAWLWLIRWCLWKQNRGAVAGGAFKVAAAGLGLTRRPWAAPLRGRRCRGRRGGRRRRRRVDPAAPPEAALPVPADPRGWEERGGSEAAVLGSCCSNTAIAL